MPTTRPGYIWSGTEWVAIGQEAVLAPVNYQTSAPSTPATGDIWIDSDDDVPSVDSTLFYRWTKTMSGGETSLSGTDDNSLTLKYTPGYEELFINGVLQVRGSDYVATTGTSITGLTALSAGDVVMIQSTIAYSVGDTYTQATLDGKFSPITTTGLVLLNTTDFTSVSAITIDNVFSNSYKTYKVLIQNTGTSATDIQLRFRASGTTTSANYSHAIVYTESTSGPARDTSTSNTQILCGMVRTTQTFNTFDVLNPYVAGPTVVVINSYGFTAGSATSSYIGGGGQNSSTQFDGLYIYPNAGNLTGTIKVYGYK